MGMTGLSHKHPFNSTFDRHRQSMPTAKIFPQNSCMVGQITIWFRSTSAGCSIA